MPALTSSQWKLAVCLVAVLMATLAGAVATLPPILDQPVRAPPARVVKPLAELAARMERHVNIIASDERNTRTPAQLERAASYIEASLAAEHYSVQRQQYSWDGHQVRNIEVSISNLAPGKQPERIFIVGAHYDSVPGAPGADDNGSGTAAVIELARLLKGMRLATGTELKFVFFVNEEPPYFMTEGMGSWRHARDLRERGQKVEAALILETIGYYSDKKNSQRYPPGLARFYPNAGNFIAFVGTLESAALVRQALAAFRASATFPAEGLAAPAFVEGVTLSDHSSYKRFGYPALMITDTAFLRYPYYHTAQDTPDKLDYTSMARVVAGLAKAIEAMTGAKST
ncbi:MAG: M28 family peptidase [Telluria sp.]|nr:M20/M25/M40 family metallo-hydrolase [Telluria sp.]